MTKQQLRRRVQDYCAALHLPPRMEGVRVQLTEYPDADTLAFLRPGEDLATQRAINAEFAAEVTRRGALPVFVTLHLDDYFTWLARFDLRDSPAVRAQFISWTSAPDDSKPPPRQA